MAKVVAYKDPRTGEVEDFDSMFKRFKKQVQNDNILYELKRREYYVPKSLKRKLKALEALKRTKRKISKNKKKNRD